MPDSALTILACFVAYLLGSILFAPLVSRFWGLPDPRALGSGNPGATNVYRAGGWAPAAATLALDALKGAAAVWIGQTLSLGPMAMAIVALCAVTGHMLPLFARFQGGKGVATAFGTGLALAPLTTLLLAAIWALVMKRWHISSMASISAAVAGPIICVFLEPEALPLFGLLTLLILVRHRDNLIRLAQRREHRL
ncbi:glycerol-3-phosphate 1-O-acyltransferase PlsY [Marinobacter nanhaiticus D15-8W]|uniref:Glycerol-3-phosphate acyltransferase n=1 Tax=Marinobacter nanhaiticus D15-8W TaxID=626887 RepID=N6W392_9GAMM|nr:glycerol-3-phosphate 1-O-acyltransferase PlsY [Marinobacter nanhaiticus]ENO14569.1 glycerol-3-phosphate 1-O-acyltransferase [Marinobacter nanhaiticus D15-8W]BES69791.1 glycerol-3-phosphate 1-O-acyltransferase PlsY [Marinobacter nanhaiticus D15-8W]